METTELSTLAPSLKGTQSHTCKNTPTAFLGAPHFPKLTLQGRTTRFLSNPNDIQKTAITAPFGLLEFPCMSFGLRKAAQTFRFMDEIL